MHRVARNDLKTSIAVSLKTAPAVHTRKFKSKLPHESDEGANALAERICSLIDNAGTMVIAAEMVGSGAGPHALGPGSFGVTEPDPFA